jgi:hypothetical protein
VQCKRYRSQLFAITTSISQQQGLYSRKGIPSTGIDKQYHCFERFIIIIVNVNVNTETKRRR